MTRLAHLDPFSGAAGDMLLGALLDAGLPEARLRADLAPLGLAGWRLEVSRVTRGGVAGTRVEVLVDADAPARTADELISIVADAPLAGPVRGRACRVLERLVGVEAAIHGVPRERIHLHELSGLDTIVDVIGTVAGFAALDVARVVVGTVEIGGSVRLGEGGPPEHAGTHTGLPAGHGPLPVPAPATLALVAAHGGRPGLVVRGSPSGGEALTPTGAALLAELADETGPLPALRVERIGYGAGARERGPGGRPTLLRLVLGEAAEPAAAEADPLAAGIGARDERIAVVACEIDDLQPEAYEPLRTALAAAGALDVTLTAVLRKKGRPGVGLRALALPSASAAVAAALFEHSTTIGLRVDEVRRIALARETVELQTPFGSVAARRARTPRGWRTRPEHEAVAERARDAGAPYRDVYDATLAAAARLDQELP